MIAQGDRIRITVVDDSPEQTLQETLVGVLLELVIFLFVFQG